MIPLDELTDVIADEIQRLVREAMSATLPCDLGDACVELACEIADNVVHRITAEAN
jgi:hypothetical protein